MGLLYFLANIRKVIEQLFSLHEHVSQQSMYLSSKRLVSSGDRPNTYNAMPYAGTMMTMVAIRTIMLE